MGLTPSSQCAQEGGAASYSGISGSGGSNEIRQQQKRGTAIYCGSRSGQGECNVIRSCGLLLIR